MTTLIRLALQKKGDLITLGLLALLCSQRHAGFMIWLFVAPIILYHAAQTMRFRKNPVRLSQHLFSFGASLLVALEIASVHTYLHVTSRTQADQVVNTVLSYKATHGHYPNELTAIEDTKTMPPRELMLGYSSKEKPQLFYAETFVPFAVWVYDFKSLKWEGPFD